jgi:hypothetical protein
MTEQILSAGVYAYENDQSFYSQGTSATGLAVVGPTSKGAAFVPTDVTTYSQFSAKFGADTSTSYTAQTVYNYLQAGTTAKVVRVLGNGGFKYSTDSKLIAITSGSYILSVLYPTQNDNAAVGLSSGSSFAGNYSSFGATVLAQSGSGIISSSFSSSLNPTSDLYLTKVLGNDANYQTGSIFPYLLFSNFITGSGALSVTSSFGTSSIQFTSANCTFTSSNASGYDHASTPWVLADSGVRLFKFHHTSDGFATNKDIKISIANIKVGSSLSTYSTFDVLVRQWNDTDKNPSLIEQFIGVTLDPDSANFLPKVIGDKYSYYDTANAKVLDHGYFVNNSNYIRVEVTDGVANGGTHAQLIPNGFEALSETIAGFPGFTLPKATTINSTAASFIYSGFDYGNVDNLNYLNPVPQEAGSGLNVNFVKPAGDNKFTLPFQGGTDGMNYTVIKKIGANIAADGTNVFGFDLSTSSTAGTLAYGKALSIISNKEQYLFDLLSIPGVIEEYHAPVTALGQALVESRIDAVYIRDLTGVNSTIASAVAAAAPLDSSYCAVYYPWLLVRDLGSSKNVFVPASVVVPQVYAYSDRVSAEWFAPAGLSRGLVSATDTRIRLSKADRDALYVGRVNPIAKFPQGLAIWGQKTLQIKDTALNRINVRRLLINLRTYISNVANNYVFENNTTATRNSLVSAITPYMESVQSRQGLYAFRVQIDDTLNTNDVIDRNQLIGKIYISPAKSIEFILLEFNVTATGATFQ